MLFGSGRTQDIVPERVVERAISTAEQPGRAHRASDGRIANAHWLVIPGEAPFAWLLPAVGFVAVVLAASTWVSPLRSAVAVSFGWLAVVWLLAAARATAPDAVLQTRAQAGFLALAAASLVIFLVRRRRLRQLRPWR